MKRGFRATLPVRSNPVLGERELVQVQVDTLEPGLMAAIQSTLAIGVREVQNSCATIGLRAQVIRVGSIHLRGRLSPSSFNKWHNWAAGSNASRCQTPRLGHLPALTQLEALGHEEGPRPTDRKAGGVMWLPCKKHPHLPTKRKRLEKVSLLASQKKSCSPISQRFVRSKRGAT